VLYPARLNVPKSLERVIRKGTFAVTFDRDFRGVIGRCRSAARPNQDEHETWITPDMVEAYCALHAAGFAHSVEVWREGELVGGLFYFGYPGGSGLMAGSVFGRLAGQAAARG
jgi:leucyl/phenylalanyl-tRNA--protein transferase